MTDSDDGVATQALRAVGRLGDPELVARAAIMVGRPGTSPLLAAEAVDVLTKTPAEDAGREVLDAYRAVVDESSPPHRRHPQVSAALERNRQSAPAALPRSEAT
ncbi:hypothetical protein ACFZDJ_25885 [Streptomyces sp. NPDC007896]|uniref:hypothetical protein n=1 Tax=unclassified Streptomyces TaxID=2593676 RepID=UPI0036E80803